MENIVYYKDDTHYFVMTAKKDSLLKKKVLRKVSTPPSIKDRPRLLATTVQDYSDTNQLLQSSNINMEQLYAYSTEAADWCTDLPRLDFAVSVLCLCVCTVKWMYSVD